MHIALRRALKMLALLGVRSIMPLSVCAGAETMTYSDLLNRLVDLERLAILPPAGEKTAQASSYDRRSRYDAETDQYIEWGANADGHHTSAASADEAVLAELEGPGCIWRIWTATAGKGHVKIYLDGAETPAVDLPFAGYFDGANAPFDRPGLTYISARGHNSYIPIPFQKSCRIVAEKEWGQYYHFTYSRFPAETHVPTFTRDLSPEDQAALDRVNELLSTRLGTHPGPAYPDQETDTISVEVAPGERVPVITLTGARAITSLRATVSDLTNRAEEIAAMRELTISIRWDGSETPAVWSPLGDFFGTAIGLNRYRSLVSGIDDDGRCYSFWYMPFEREAAIVLGNDGPHGRRISLEVTHAPLTRPAADYGRFHAKWHRDAFLPTRADRWPDWTVLTTQGRGRFCGMMLHVWNPRAGHNRQFGREGHFWWGEGDEKFFVDGEKFPSIFGTGTEDYFGYAWCLPDLFQQAFHGQTLTQNNKGHQVVHRWHIADSVPFQTSFDGYLEKYFPNHWPTHYAAVAYWYLDPSGIDLYGPHTLTERTGYYDLTDANEGENLRIVSITGGTAEPQIVMKDRGSGDSIFSGGAQLWWKEGRPGDQLTIALPVTLTGRYRVRLGMARAPDYGIARIRFNGQAPLHPIDFFERTLEPVEIDLGEFDLKRDEVPLSLEIIGANRRAEHEFMLGVDYVKLVPAD